MSTNLTSIFRELPVPLTTEQVNERARRQSDLIFEVGQLEEEKKAATSRITSDIKATMKEVRDLGREIRTGERMEEIECVASNNYEAGLVEYARVDTGEIVQTTTMTLKERQMQFPGTAPDEDDDVTEEEQEVLDTVAQMSPEQAAKVVEALEELVAEPAKEFPKTRPGEFAEDPPKDLHVDEARDVVAVMTQEARTKKAR